MRQQPLPLQLPASLGFDTLVVSRANALAVAQVQRIAQGPAPAGTPTLLYLWGPPGAGRTRLLQAAGSAWADRGGRAEWLDPPRLARADHAAAAAALGADGTTGPVLLLLDDVQSLSPAAQQHAFAWLVEAQGAGVGWIATGDRPPVDLPLRDDLRSRLGWGAVHAVHPLGDDALADELRGEARRRGFTLSDELVDWVMNRQRRDARHLMRLLERLDRFALAAQRRVTLPLLRRMLDDERTAASASGPAHDDNAAGWPT